MSSEAAGGSPGLAGEEFRRACGRFATGVAVASVLDGQGAPHGLTVSSVAAVSLDPPLLLFSIGHASEVVRLFRAAGYFGLSVLRREQRDLSERFARKGQNRFDGVDWRPGQAGVPLLGGALAQVACALYRRVAAGDHDIFIGEALAAQVHSGEPLIHYASRYRSLAP
jgi:flavin reductase (DIM6/NTAB) family NADH-FMN oxidoreductase RutF